MIRINSVNDVPVIYEIADTSFSEDGSLALMVYADDVDSTELSYSVESTNESVFADIINDISGVHLQMNAAPNYNGSSDIIVTVDDNFQNGNLIDNALVVDELPFSDFGSTEFYFDNYNECAFEESDSIDSNSSPDVVYSFYAESDMLININLCGSSYDTRLFVYENVVGNLAFTNSGEEACNDDHYSLGSYCDELSSAINGVQLHSGNTYYIVIDGFMGDYGEYQINIDDILPTVQAGLRFYGQGGRVAIGESGGLYDLASYTVSAWFNPFVENASYQGIIGKGDGGWEMGYAPLLWLND